ncbi:MAG: Ig-like domain-containing protein [Spirochaetes bacterium]|nr:Ig-like domain-containing protein [Spirochaetota bacterium]
MKKIFITLFLLSILLFACSETTQNPIINNIYPVMVSSFPSNNQLDVAINLVQIQVIFNENLTGIDNASFSVNNGVLGTISYDPSIKTAVFTISNGELSPSTVYTVSLSSDIKDTENNSLIATNFSFTTGTISDNTPPSWNTGWPKYDNVSDSSFNLKYKINETGSVYYVVVSNNSTAPTSEQVKNGADYNGIPVFRSGTASASGNIEGTKTVAGLVQNTAYDIYIVPADNFNNLNTVPVSLTVTTLDGPLTGPLTLGNWVSGSLTAGEIKWHYFNATAGKTYGVYWDDSYQGSGSYTSDIKVSAFNSDFSVTNFSHVDSGYNTPELIQADSSGKYYIKVEEYYSGSSHGTYAIKVEEMETYTVSGTVTLPATVSGVTNSILISEDPYLINPPIAFDSIIANGNTFTYSLNAIAGTYYIYAMSDINKNGILFNSGDYLGYYGGSSINPPASANLVIDGNKTGINFNLGIIP